jgi:hypothetical protein
MGVAASGVLAPVRLKEEYEVRLDTPSKTEVTAKGIGVGMELSVAFDMYTDARMNILLELYGRAGSTNAKLDREVFDGTNIPANRDVDFTGTGLRMGFRWI